jgi:hypothetical protein
MMKTHWKAKSVLAASAVVGLLSTSGCFTDKTLTAAQEYKPHKEISSGPSEEEKEAKPGYYALLPFAVVGDIALAPVYLGWWVYCVSTGNID